MHLKTSKDPKIIKFEDFKFPDDKDPVKMKVQSHKDGKYQSINLKTYKYPAILTKDK